MRIAKGEKRHFEMLCTLDHNETIKHIVKQPDEDDAQAKIMRAYPKREVTIVKIVKL